MAKSDAITNFMDQVKKMEKGEKLDLSSGEDLSVGIMNLIAIEEHLFFSGGKTGQVKYYELLNEVRKLRVELLREIVKDEKGEEWCISKHLLSASMRVMEVGTKALKKGEKEKAYALFKKSYDLYNLFWGLNLGMVKKGEMQKTEIDKKEQLVELTKNDFFGKISNAVGKILDCCKE